MKTSRLLTFLKYLFLILALIVAVGPLITIVGTSLQETYTLTGQKLTRNRDVEYTFSNYIRLLTKTKYPRWVLNTIIFAGGVVVIKVIIDTFAGYAFARYKFPGGNFIFGLILVSMMLPFAVILFPTFMITNKLRLLNTYPGLILPILANPFGIFLMRQFILSIPREIEESARIDGCSDIGVLFRIIMPLSRPGQAVLAIVIFMWQWTNLIWPLVATNSEEMFTITVGLATIPAQHFVDWGLLTAGGLLSVVPIIIFFLFYQRGFIKGLTMGAVKE
jgi:ABC-type glycerol-3-phosphate transport system permease component